MSNRNKIYSKGRIPGQWTALRWEVMDSPAWKHMRTGCCSSDATLTGAILENTRERVRNKITHFEEQKSSEGVRNKITHPPPSSRNKSPQGSPPG